MRLDLYSFVLSHLMLTFRFVFFASISFPLLVSSTSLFLPRIVPAVLTQLWIRNIFQNTLYVLAPLMSRIVVVAILMLGCHNHGFIVIFLYYICGWRVITVVTGATVWIGVWWRVYLHMTRISIWEVAISTWTLHDDSCLIRRVDWLRLWVILLLWLDLFH